MSNNQIDFNNFLDKTNNQNNVSIGVFSFLMVVVIMLCFLIPFIIHKFFGYLINSLIANEEKQSFKNEILDCIKNVANSNDNKKNKIKNIMEEIRRNEDLIRRYKKLIRRNEDLIKKIIKIDRNEKIIIFVSLCLLIMFISILSHIIILCRTAKKINNKLKNDSQGTLQKQKECSRFIMDYSIGMLVIMLLITMLILYLPFYFNNKSNNRFLIFAVLIIIISIGLYSAMIHENNKILNDIEQFSV